jgi:hypothetical protein
MKNIVEASTYPLEQHARTAGCGPTKSLLNHILAEGKFDSTHDLEAAAIKQEQSKQQIENILVDMGVLNPADLKACPFVQMDVSTQKNAVITATGARIPLGEVLLKAKRITQEQLELSLEEQKRTGEKLGMILMRCGLITADELAAVLTFQQYQSGRAPASEIFRLGDILLAANHISHEQLEVALSKQKLSKKKLGELLIEGGYVQPHQVEHGLKLQKELLAAALIASLSLSSAHSVHASGTEVARSANCEIRVTATVKAYAILKIKYQDPKIIITPGDIERGYVNVHNASCLEIRNNNRAGYLLVFEGQNESVSFFKEVYIQGLGKDVQIDSIGGLILQPYISGTITLQLSYRFILSHNANPGTYAWPLMMSAQPL